MRAKGVMPAALGRRIGAHQDQRRGAVVDAAGIAGGHRAFLVEGRAQLGQAFRRGAVFGILVGVDHYVALAGLNGDRGQSRR